MKPRNPSHLLAAGALALVFSASDSHAQTDRIWTPGDQGDFSDSANYDNGAPVAGDSVFSDGSGSIIEFGADDSISLNVLRLNGNSGATVFNHDGGTLTVNTLTFGGAGGSRNPTYNLSAGTLNTQTAFTWGSGSNARFNMTGGTVNHAPGNFFSLGTAGGANGAIVMSGGTFNANAVTNFRLGGSNGGTGGLDLSGDAVFSATASGTTYLGNNGGSGYITMSGNSQLDLDAMAVSIGQFGNGTGTLTMADDATLTAGRIVIGGDNNSSAITGVIHLDGGTIATAAIQRGSSSVAPSATQNVLHGNGGTIRVTADARNADFFGRNDGSAGGLYVNLEAGGLNFDTNGNATTIADDVTVAGTGGLTKQGAGTLTLNATTTYAGLTRIEGGTLALGGDGSVTDSSGIDIATGAALDVSGLNAATFTVGSGQTLSGSGAIVATGKTVQIDGALNIGASPGLMTVTGSVNLAGTTFMEIDGPGAAGVGYDSLSVSETLSYGGDLSVLFGAALTSGTFNLFEADTLADSSNFTTVSVNGYGDDPIDLSRTDRLWTGGDGNGITFSFDEASGVFTVVPEPSQAVLAALGALALGIRRSRAVRA